MLQLSFDDYINYQHYQECALISILNAYQFLYQEKIDKYKFWHYESKYITNDGIFDFNLRDQLLAELGLKIKVETNNFLDIVNDFVLPIEMAVQMRANEADSLHSILLIHYNHNYKIYQATNFLEKTTKEGFIFSENLFFYEPRNLKYRSYICYQKAK